MKETYLHINLIIICNHIDLQYGEICRGMSYWIMLSATVMVSLSITLILSLYIYIYICIYVYIYIHGTLYYKITTALQICMHHE